MECPADKPSKTPANISDMVTNFTKVCKFRSIGVFTSENQCNDIGKRAPVFLEESRKDFTEENKFDWEKIYPLIDEERSIKGCACGHMDVSELFESVSAVKAAYVKFQEAHIPYDRDKIVAADKHMVDQLDLLCKSKRSLKEKKMNEVNSFSTCLTLKKEIEVQKSLLDQLKSQVKMKERAVISLQSELQDLELKYKSLAEEFKLQEKVTVNVLHIHSFEEIVKAVRMAIHDFAKALIALMKVSGWDLDQAANAMEGKVVYAKRSHQKYAFEAYIARRMFNGFPSQQPFDTGRLIKLDEAINALIQDPQSDFAKFCRNKYLRLVHPWMEISFFGNLDHRTFVTNGLHPYTQFYRAFVKMAKWVWCLQGSIASSTSPKIETFAVTRGTEFSDVYMESTVELEENALISHQEDSRYKVEFMILPGFKVGNSVIRSQVYLSKVNYKGA